MNAPVAPKHLMNQVSGQLLMAGYQYDDGLVLDLYGSVDADGEHSVESIAVAGTTVEISQLFRARQMRNIGLFLDLRGSTTVVSRDWAERYRHHAASFLD